MYCISVTFILHLFYILWRQTKDQPLCALAQGFSRNGADQAVSTNLLQLLKMTQTVTSESLTSPFLFALDFFYFYQTSAKVTQA